MNQARRVPGFRKMGYTQRIFRTFDIAGVQHQPIIYLFRDPLDALISAYYYYKQIPSLKHLASTSLDAFCTSNIESYNQHLNAALILKEVHPENVLLLNMKSLSDAPKETLELIHMFLGLPLDEMKAAQAINNCDLEQYLLERTEELPSIFSDLDLLEHGNNLSRVTIDSIVSTLMPVYQEANGLSEQNYVVSPSEVYSQMAMGQLV